MPLVVTGTVSLSPVYKSVECQQFILQEGFLAGIGDSGSLCTVIDVGLSSLSLGHIITEDFHLGDVSVVPAADEILEALVADAVRAENFYQRRGRSSTDPEGAVCTDDFGLDSGAVSSCSACA